MPNVVQNFRFFEDQFLTSLLHSSVLKALIISFLVVHETVSRSVELELALKDALIEKVIDCENQTLCIQKGFSD